MDNKVTAAVQEAEKRVGAVVKVGAGYTFPVTTPGTWIPKMQKPSKHYDEALNLRESKIAEIALTALHYHITEALRMRLRAYVNSDAAHKIERLKRGE